MPENLATRRHRNQAAHTALRVPADNTRKAEVRSLVLNNLRASQANMSVLQDQTQNSANVRRAEATALRTEATLIRVHAAIASDVRGEERAKSAGACQKGTVVSVDQANTCLVLLDVKIVMRVDSHPRRIS